MSGTELHTKAPHPCAGQSWGLSWGSAAGSQSWDSRAAVSEGPWFGCGSNEESLMKCSNQFHLPLHVGVHGRREAQCVESIRREVSPPPLWVRERS